MIRALVVSLALLGCAAGGEAEGTGNGGAGGVAGGGGVAGTAASGGVAGGGGTGATGASGGSGGVAGGGGSGGVTCPKINTCETAGSLGTLTGDSDNAGVLSASGTGQEFFRLRVTEDNHSPLGEALELKTTLAVPQGSDFDLYVYIDTNVDTTPCPLQPAQASANGPGTTEETILTWGDGITGSGNDDSRDVVVEVRFGGFACNGEWTLTLQGNP
jgi:hypothetical protein